MPNLYTLTGDFDDLLGGDGLVIRKAYIETNIAPDKAIVNTTGKKIRLGWQSLSFTAGNVFAADNLVGSNSTDLNIPVDTLQYQVVVEYAPGSAGPRETRMWRSGWFFLNATSNLADLAVTDAPTPVTGTLDADVANLVNPTSQTGQKLSATYATTVGLAEVEADVAEKAPVGAVGRAPGGKVLHHPEHIRRTLAKIAGARYRLVDIGVFGMSIVEGVGSDDTADTTLAAENASWQTRSAVRQFASNLADRYGDAGEGAVWYGAEQGQRVVVAGGGTKAGPNTSLGYGGHRLQLAAGQTATITTPVCTQIDIHWQGLQGGYSYTVDGGASVPVAAAATDLAKTSITGLADTTHTLVITGPASGTFFSSCLVFRRKTTSGVCVHRFGWPGKVEADAWADAQPAGGIMANFTQTVKDRQRKSITSELGMDLAVLWYDVNAVTGGWTTYGLTPTQLQANVQNLVTRLIADGMDVLLLVGLQRQPGSYSAGGYTQADYMAAYEAVAAATDRCAYLDLGAALGDYATANADGLMVDTAHPSYLGHSDVARVLTQALAP